MARYAERTIVTVDKSKNEIERMLTRYGAERFGYFVEPERAIILFEYQARRIRFVVPMPDRNDHEFTHTPTGLRRKPDAADTAHEQAVRQRWRALVLVIKAKLEAIETGLVTFDEEFLAHTMLPSGGTFGQWAKPQLDHIYETGQMPPMLHGATEDVLALEAGEDE